MTDLLTIAADKEANGVADGSRGNGRRAGEAREIKRKEISPGRIATRSFIRHYAGPGLRPISSKYHGVECPDLRWCPSIHATGCCSDTLYGLCQLFTGDNRRNTAEREKRDRAARASARVLCR